MSTEEVGKKQDGLALDEKSTLLAKWIITSLFGSKDNLSKQFSSIKSIMHSFGSPQGFLTKGITSQPLEIKSSTAARPVNPEAPEIITLLVKILYQLEF